MVHTPHQKTICIRLFSSFVFLALFHCPILSSPQQPADLRCEFLRDPLGIDVLQPRLSWVMASGSRGERQTAYQIMVASTEALLKAGNADLWNSDKIESDQSIHVRYAGKALQSHMQCFWKVRIWNKDGKASAWSKTAKWTMGLLDSADWRAQWIGRDEVDKTYHLTGTQWVWFPEGDPTKEVPAETRYFRRAIQLPEGKTVKEAHFHITGDDSSAIFVNGKQLLSNDDFMTVPDIDATSVLHEGTNLLAASVHNAGTKPNPAGLVGRLDITFTDGSSLTIRTDSLWKTTNRENAGWQSLEFIDTGWVAAKVVGPVGMHPWGEMLGFSDRRLPARWMRKEFTAEKPLRRATVCISGLGLSELYINGKKVGDHVLSPALSEYPKRVYYVTHEVTSAILKGVNAIGVVLGNGRFFAPRHGQSDEYPKLLLQLHLEYVNGTSQDILSDDSWKLTTDGPILANNEYDGEEYDARKELVGWSQTGYDDSGWEQAQVVHGPQGELHSHMSVPIRVTGTLKPIAVSEPKPGMFIFDMGQNMVGWCRLNVRGPSGTKVTLRHAETLRPDGTLNTDNLRSATATDTFILKGVGSETYEPRFTYHGFRFVALEGYPGRPDFSSIEGRVVNDDVETAGEFNCSNPVINRTYKNVVWGVRGNYRSISTDCPQRDERQGWLGDRSSESKGETYLFDVASHYSKWIQDMADAQNDSGSISDVSPSYWALYNDNVTWPSSAVIIPGGLLDQYADSALIVRHYPAMVRWIDHMSKYITDSIITRDDYGDWCVPPEDLRLIHSNDPTRKTAGGVIATSYFYHDLRLMSRYASLLRKPADARRFDAMADGLEIAFNRRYYNKEKGQYDNGTQTSCVLPLAFGMVPAEERQRVFDHLVDNITNVTKNHVGTGLIGGQFLNRVLTDFGRPDIAFTFATNTTYPSWGYMAEMGATTIWELWNGNSADPAMNSGNHVMLVGDFVIWLYEHLGGIRPDPAWPGFKHIVLQPVLTGDLTFVNATHKSPYGLISSRWQREKDKFTWDVLVPTNTLATVYVPSSESGTITEGGIDAKKAKGLQFLRREKGYAVFEAVPGKYIFRSLLPAAQ
ncbi:MAG: glycoside hydrolase family 78 protein [Bacteroidota bacterium]